MGLITEYKCPNCGAPLAFDAAAGKVKCENCGHESEVGDLIDAQKEDGITEEFNWGNYKDSLSGERLEDVVVYQCQSCGAVIETDKNTVATTCPYCDNNVVITDRVSGGLKPNAIIPFEITKKELPDILQRFYKDKKYLPKDFFSTRVIEKAQGVYVPFWLFDCKVAGNVAFNTTRSAAVTTAKEIITTTSHFLSERDGEMEFSNVPVDASVKMDNDLMDSLEPYYYSKIKDFDGAYLAGFVADRFDSSPDDEISRVTERTVNSAVEAMRSTVTGFETVNLRSNRLHLENANVKYALLPVYLFNCTYKGKKYRYAVNGQTGKVVADLPISQGKIFKHSALVAGIVTVIVFGLAVGLALL